MSLLGEIQFSLIRNKIFINQGFTKIYSEFTWTKFRNYIELIPKLHKMINRPFDPFDKLKDQKIKGSSYKSVGEQTNIVKLSKSVAEQYCWLSFLNRWLSLSKPGF